MSRCFPYNPLSGGEQSGALIESIKLQKRDKTEKKRKREKKHEKVHGEWNVRMEDVKQGYMRWKQSERDQLDDKSHCHPKAKRDESEQLEKSGLTEEYDLACPPSTRGQDSPDSSQYSYKRKVGAPELNRISHGSLLLRIKVLAQRPKEPEQPELKEPELPACVPTVAVEPTCLSGRTGAAVPKQQEYQREADGLCDVGFKSFLGSKRSRRRGAKYDGLFASWCLQPPQVESLPTDDQDWLLGPKGKQQELDVKGCWCERENSIDSRSLLAWPPRACSLPEADLYVLPFVVPF